jgi:phosphoadenosine phosphosulfate reductase
LASAPALPDVDFEAMTAEDLLEWAAAEFGHKLVLTCSWQKQSSVLVHMASELGLDVDFVELDTHLFFRETYETRERLIERYGIQLIRPEIITVAEQHRAEGPNLWERDPDRCCHIRKVEPLLAALRPYDAWASGIRRDQSPSRAGTPKVEWSERYEVWKLHPLADWNEKRVWAYIGVNEIPYNPLHDSGYRSIGCMPCTRPTRPDEEERAGRWAGSDKLECGIHVDSPLGGESITAKRS